MGYIKDIEEELRGMLSGLEPELREPIVKYLKTKAWESYKNGLKAEKKGKAPEQKPGH